MSGWMTYVSQITSVPGVLHAGIYGLDGNAWAQSEGFEIPSSKVLVLADGIGDISKLSGGVHIMGIHFMGVNSIADFCVLKRDNNGLVVFKANSCILVALHDETVKSEVVTTKLGKLKDFFAKSGY